MKGIFMNDYHSRHETGVFSRLGDRILSLFFPPRCILCDRVVEYDMLHCGHCHIPLNEPDLTLLTLPETRVECVSPFSYAGNVREALLRLKSGEKPEPRLLQFFAGSLLDTIGRQWSGSFDLLVPVPMSTQRLRQLGFNHAQLLAEELAGPLCSRVETKALIRSDQTRAQHTLPAPEREKNAFRSYRAGETAGLRNKRILLVDDILTTGATLRACAAILTQAGAHVCASTVARVALEAGE